MQMINESDKIKENEQIIPFRHNLSEILKKSNKFIGAKYKASVLENQVTYLAMLKIQNKEYMEDDGDIVVTLKASEIKKEVGSASGSFYEGLKRVADDMTANNIGIIDDENERFAFISLVSMATYDKGDFSIYFPKRLKNSLINVANERKGFTGIPKKVAMGLKKPYSFPLYQMLRAICYYPTGYKGRRDNVFEYEIGLSELKLDLGVVNSNLPDVRKVLNNSVGTIADYDKAVSKSPDKMYNLWSKFNLQCLQPTVNEINEKSDIFIEYEPKTRGKGGKVYAILFRVYIEGAEKNMPNANAVALDEEGEIHSQLPESDKFVFALEIGTLLASLNLGYTDIMAICEAANYNKEDIERAFNILKKQGGNINNVTGWLIAAIKQNYTSASASVTSENKPINKFNNFHQRKYDMDEMEKLWLTTSID